MKFDGFFFEDSDKTMNIGNSKYKLEIENGIISGLYSDVFGFLSNLSLKGGKCGSTCFTYSDDDIKLGKENFLHRTTTVNRCSMKRK